MTAVDDAGRLSMTAVDDERRLSMTAEHQTALWLQPSVFSACDRMIECDLKDDQLGTLKG